MFVFLKLVVDVLLRKEEKTKSVSFCKREEELFDKDFSNHELFGAFRRSKS